MINADPLTNDSITNDSVNNVTATSDTLTPDAVTYSALNNEASIERLHQLPILFAELGLSQLSLAQQQLIAQIDACLPQTQCGLCDHPDGCLPYAAAIVVDDEPINKCVPGGQPVTDTIAQLTNRPSLPVSSSKWPTHPSTHRPIEVRAVIREDDCIGCTKCIPACPVDAIVGTGKHMHTIFTDLCTGCELCLPPCPVDCIDLVEVTVAPSAEQRIDIQADLRERYHHHLDRVTAQLSDSSHAKPVISMVEAKLGNVTHQTIDIGEAEAKSTIAAAKLRTQIKKLEKQLSIRPSPSKAVQLDDLKAQLEALN
ncbi:MAG: RnfABCDGE type electron transport complex subunit B [Psychrobacter sp.]|nr:RnfABCDGE type electron transport complex subunit B [Psychrobacter sp.]